MQAIDAARRLQILHAMGLQPQVLRSREAAPAAPACLLLAPAGVNASAQAFLHSVLAAMGLPASCLRICEPGSRRNSGLGRAANWVVFGADAERALQLHLGEAADAQPAQIIVSHDLQRLLREPLLKRELWQSLRPLRQRLAGAEA